MEDFAYLEKLQLFPEQKKKLRDQGIYNTAAMFYGALTQGRHQFKQWLSPIDIDVIRGQLWNMMSEKEREPFMPKPESATERFFGGLGAVLVLGFLFFLFASCAGGCSNMLFR